MILRNVMCGIVNVCRPRTFRCDLHARNIRYIRGERHIPHVLTMRGQPVGRVMCGKASRAVLARVVSTGTLLALLGVVGLSGVRGQEPEESGRCRITSWGFPQQSGFPGEERDEQESNAAGAAAESAPEEKKEEPPPTYLVMESLQGTSIGRWLDSRKI